MWEQSKVKNYERKAKQRAQEKTGSEGKKAKTN